MSSKKYFLDQLGATQSVASGKLKKALILALANKLKIDNCYRCSLPIKTPEELSVDHKTPWLHKQNAKELYFDIENIAFSHSKCNSRAIRYKNWNAGKTHCKRGHAFTEDNTYLVGKERTCKECKRLLRGRDKRVNHN